MTVGQLRKIIENLPDDLPVVVYNWDGEGVQYAFEARATRVVQEEHYLYDMPDDEFEKDEDYPIKVLLIS